LWIERVERGRRWTIASTPVTHSVDVVVPVHNRWELTESCLEHLRRQTLPRTVIVCDNGSTDGTPDRLRESFPDVVVVKVGANLGFSVACNRGVRAGDAEIVVLMNNDVICPPDFLERLVAPLARDERLGSVTSLLLQSGEKLIESFGLTVDATLAGYPRLRGLHVDALRGPRPVLAGPSGAAGAYRRQAWEQVGGLDEGVFAYGEDVDLALRLRTAGWMTTEAPDAVGVHLGSATAGGRSAWQRYQSGYARAYFLRRYGLGVRAAATEGLVVLADTLVFSRDLAAARGRVAGWKAARSRPRNPRPPADAIDARIGFVRSMRLRRAVFTGR
jgi:N-acetylglucosaminyl-diphospho-decaprenol L-rhamnosyltransferase